jgi:hypothetical protein
MQEDLAQNGVKDKIEATGADAETGAVTEEEREAKEGKSLKEALAVIRPVAVEDAVKETFISLKRKKDVTA